jgi:hypothetical protein
MNNTGQPPLPLKKVSGQVVNVRDLIQESSDSPSQLVSDLNIPIHTTTSPQFNQYAILTPSHSNHPSLLHSGTFKHMQLNRHLLVSSLKPNRHTILQCIPLNPVRYANHPRPYKSLTVRLSPVPLRLSTSSPLSN